MPKQKNAYLELAITCKNVAFRSCSTSRNFYGGLNISGVYTFFCRENMMILSQIGPLKVEGLE